jgi:hypothetical protein
MPRVDFFGEAVLLQQAARERPKDPPTGKVDVNHRLERSRECRQSVEQATLVGREDLIETQRTGVHPVVLEERQIDHRAARDRPRCCL